MKTIVLLLITLSCFGQSDKYDILFDNYGWSIMQSYRVDNSGQSISDTSYSVFCQDAKFNNLYQPICIYKDKGRLGLNEFMQFIFRSFNEVAEHCTNRNDKYNISVGAFVVDKKKYISVISHDNNDSYGYFTFEIYKSIIEKI